MAVVVSWQPEDSLEDMPEYLAAPPAASGRVHSSPRDVWLEAQRRVVALVEGGSGLDEAPAPPSAARISARFLRLVPLPGPRLTAMLDEWWSDGVKNGVLTVDRRLRLEPPRGDDRRGWIIKGRVRRFTRWHWVPVVVELWPVYDKWAMMTMTPRVRVVASRHYFRTGQSVLDRLTTALAETRANSS